MGHSELVQISNRTRKNESGLSRRSFLKILGSASAAGVAGCADSAKQKAFPNVEGQEFQIPGVAQWYRSTCQECTAGCGISVRVREGRAVKIEGNKEDPLSRGGLCGLGQSALQGLYDPDRVRQPLKRTSGERGSPVFEPISWSDAIAQVAGALTKSKGKGVLFTEELSGSTAKLSDAFCEAFGLQRVTYDVMQPTDVAEASELVFGKYGIPHYEFEKADVVVSFGADFLETWNAPVTYARGWAQSRKGSRPARYIHIDPRLSLTGANADSWLMCRPGGERAVALALLKLLLKGGMGSNVSSDVLAQTKSLVSGLSLAELERESGVDREKLLLVAEYLREARTSLVVAGGSSSRTEDPTALPVLANLLNLVLSNVGKTVFPGIARVPATSFKDASAAVEKIANGENEVVLIAGGNPAYALPTDVGFRYAVNRASLVVSFASVIDESAQLADLILPRHHSLESWGDSERVPGVAGVVQPVMLPVFDTKDYGDLLLELAAAGSNSEIASGASSFQEYVANQWKVRHADASISEPFDSWWREVVENGVFVQKDKQQRSFKVKVNGEVFSKKFISVDFADKGTDEKAPVLLPFPSVKTFDGRAANRPWLHELPDPVTKIVWDSWAEMHPETAKRYGLAQGDVVTVRNYFGELDVPVYVTEYVHPEVVAVPMGHGHQAYGRYAKETAHSGNVLSLLPKSPELITLPLLSTRVSLSRARIDRDLIITQGSDSQHGRGISRTRYVDEISDHEEAHGSEHQEHHEPKQMYTQRPAPVYNWGLSVDLAACTGCSACVVACYAENNIPVVGKELAGQGRHMAWLRIERYYEGTAEELEVNFTPMMCQHCNNAPCEPVCPVFATYHNEDALNVMVYNRCVGTRYCANNCSYKVRRFNWFEYEFPEPLNMQLNPDVTKRDAGVMEKCTFCVQRITEAKGLAKDEGRLVRDGEIQPACVQSCPTQALTFGNLNDKDSKVAGLFRESRAYKVLDHHINTQPSVSYLENMKYRA